MIDLHSHLLPGVDDGSRSADQSVRVLTTFVERGIDGVCCTPHCLASRVADGWPDDHETAWRDLIARVPAGMTLYRGAEVMLDRPLPAAAAERRVTLGGSRYLLVEFTRQVPAEIVARALADIVRQGLVPVLAHPERYSSCSVEAVRAWRELGGVMQVDATTLTLPSSRGDRARDLVRAGLADILAGDNHGDERHLGTALDWLVEHDGAEQATVLLDTNPRAILDDLAIYEVEPLRIRTSMWRSVRRLFEAE